MHAHTHACVHTHARTHPIPPPFPPLTTQPITRVYSGWAPFLSRSVRKQKNGEEKQLWMEHHHHPSNTHSQRERVRGDAEAYY